MELQKNVKVLSSQLMEVEASSIEDAKALSEETDAPEETEENRIEPDVRVINVNGNKLWMKMILENRRGRLTKLMEALSAHGFELNNVSVTTSMGATLISSCVEGTLGEVFEASSMSELLQEIIKHI
ncbi:uncharacterized protein LOC116208894 [Punica granatum]|uniref:ACT domain-containing protein n=2 Tax=Punica granatum TaxID=22663 RepID=A0A218WY36_PUNGR|nr:uncharacterized protein LOC116208894 [Punica granatum]OWM77624.1 hypothetical protein CDL15_Pgr017022 [Punica granatum]PKI72951.1 hypothetical protein CRG98_006651 [Punica granatum]